MSSAPSELVVVGKITTVYGVKGWVKIHSYTEPMENILAYPCFIRQRGQDWQPLVFAEARRHQKGLIALIEGVNDREQAKLYCQCELAAPAEAMPELEQGDFYWHQLEGLSVVTTARSEADTPVLLGKVDHLMATGANDVMVVKPCQGSIDQRERLIPWLPEPPGQTVTEIDLAAARILVDWDPDF